MVDVLRSCTKPSKWKPIAHCPCFFQELYEYYRHGQKASSSEEEQMGFLSSSTQHVLSSVLLQEPALGECLLQALQASSNSQYCQYNGRLQALHIAALSGLLQEVRKLAAAAGSHENTTTQDEFTDDEDKEASEEMLLKTSHTFLNLLSKMNPDESLLDELRLTPLFRDLCNMMLQFPVVAQYLPAAALYSALMGHHDEWLLRHFCNIQYEVLRREGEAFLVVGGVTQTQKTMISTSLIEDRAMAWKNIFLLCLRKKQHFIDLIVVSVHNKDLQPISMMIVLSQFKQEALPEYKKNQLLCLKHSCWFSRV